MVGLYDHQLLIWPRLIHKLRMKTRARCCCWGHYRDPTTHFSTSLSQLLQRNPIDGFQFSFQWCFSWTSQPVCQPVARVAPQKNLERLHGKDLPETCGRNTHQKVHAILTRSQPNGEISLRTYGDVLPPLDTWWRCIPIACPLAQCRGKMRTRGWWS